MRIPVFRPMNRVTVMRLIVAGFLACWVLPADAHDELAESLIQPLDEGVELAIFERFDNDLDDNLIETVAHFQCASCSLDRQSCKCRGRRFGRTCESKLELGLNGAAGNTRNVNLVLGYDAKREQGQTTTTIDIDYLYSKDDVETNKNRFYSLTRFEYDIPNSDWGWFFDQWFEHDALEDFRSRLGFHAGKYATLAETDDCEFKGLLGAGTSKELNGSDTEWKPELYLGTALEKSINDRQDFYVRAILMPDVSHFSSYRIRVKAGWECALNQKKNLKLSLSMFDRYDSTPSGSDRPNDIDYWASFVWSF